MENTAKYLLLFLYLISTCQACHSFPLEDEVGDEVDQTSQEDVLQGYYHTWWTIIPVPTDTVRQMLPDESFDLADVPIPDFPANSHPVFMEIGFEMDCGPIGLKPLWMDFEEFKYDIPYVVARGSDPSKDVYPLIYKSVLYMPTLLLAESSRISYNLNASKADAIKMTEIGYNMQKGRGLKFKAEFKPDGQWETYSSARFGIMEKIVSQTWFGKWDANLRSCGNNHYDFNTVSFRSATGTILADEGIVSPFFPSEEITVSSLNQVSYGTVEVYTNFTISAAFDCLP